MATYVTNDKGDGEQLEKQGREVDLDDLDEVLAALLDPTVTIANLSFGYPPFGDEGTTFAVATGIEKIAEGLQHENCRVTELYLAENNIGDKGTEHLVSALQHENCRVTNLDLRDNNIGDESAEHLVRALQHENCRLTNLDLVGNNIGDEGAEQLIRALQHENCRLTKLDLDDNNVDQSVLDRLQPFLAAMKEQNK